MPSTLRSLAREPLLHFIALGGLLFAIDGWANAKRDDPSLIIVTRAVKEQARSSFRSAQGREPTEAELETLRQHWIDTEMLYREGLALKLEQGDHALRERVAANAMKIIESGVQVPSADEPTLRAFFAEHQAQYDQQPRFDFSEALPQERVTAEGARALADALNGAAQGDVQVGVRLFEKHPRQAIVASFGADFAAALDRMPQGRWQVLGSDQGPSIIRLESREPGRAASFEEARARVWHDWTEAKARELRAAALRELGKKYTIRLDGDS